MIGAIRFQLHSKLALKIFLRMSYYDAHSNKKGFESNSEILTKSMKLCQTYGQWRFTAV